MSATEDVAVLALRVLPEKLGEWLNAERDPPEKGKEGMDTSGTVQDNPGSGQTR